jgi:hypothetical protein
MQMGGRAVMDAVLQMVVSSLIGPAGQLEIHVLPCRKSNRHWRKQLVLDLEIYASVR